MNFATALPFRTASSSATQRPPLAARTRGQFEGNLSDMEVGSDNENIAAEIKEMKVREAFG